MNFLVYYFSKPFFIILSALPFKLLYLISDFIYPFVYHVIRYRRKIVRKNLELVAINRNWIEKKQIEKKFYKFLCDLFVEMIKVRGMSKKDMLKRFKIKNTELIKKYHKQGKSVFVMAGHYSNFEWLLSIAYHVPHIPYGIYAPLENKYFDNYVKKVRTMHGSYLIPRKSFADDFLKLQQDKTLSLIGFASDQSPRKHSKNYYRNFFGINVPVFTGAERLGKKFNIPILMAKVRRIKRGFYETEILEIAKNPNDFDDYKITDLFYNELEKLILEEPSFYFWTHNRFKLRKSSS